MASFRSSPAMPSVSGIVKQSTKAESDVGGAGKELEEKKLADVAVAGGGVPVATSLLPPEQRRPAGPLVVLGVRDGVLWLVDRYVVLSVV